MSKSRRQVLWAFGFAGLGTLRSEEIDPVLHREGTSATDGKRWQMCSFPCAPNGDRSQPMATVFACLGGFCARAICDRLPLVATTGLHKGSALCCQLWRRTFVEPVEVIGVRLRAARKRPVAVQAASASR